MDISYFRHKLKTKKTKEVTLKELYQNNVNYFEYKGYNYVLIKSKNKPLNEFHCVNLKSCTEIYLNESTLVRPLKVTIELEKDLNIDKCNLEVLEVVEGIKEEAIKTSSYNSYFYTIII